MNLNSLEDLYDATADDLRYGIGLLHVQDHGFVPYIHIHQPGWTREMLEIVRDTFQDGLVLNFVQPGRGSREIYLATRQRVVLQAEDGHATSLLRGPAWDARLTGISPAVFRRFQADRARHAEFFLLVMQTPEWEFLTLVPPGEGRVHVDEILPRALPMPPVDRVP